MTYPQYRDILIKPNGPLLRIITRITKNYHLIILSWFKFPNLKFNFIYLTARKYLGNWRIYKNFYRKTKGICCRAFFFQSRISNILVWSSWLVFKKCTIRTCMYTVSFISVLADTYSSLETRKCPQTVKCHRTLLYRRSGHRDARRASINKEHFKLVPLCVAFCRV
jgi:hypothetical protein